MRSKDYWPASPNSAGNYVKFMNFTVLSFVTVSNNKKVCTISEYYVASIV